MIHPATLKILHPSNDYYKRDAVCRAIEKQYGLKADFGHDKWDDWRDPEDTNLKRPQRGSDRARDMKPIAGNNPSRALFSNTKRLCSLALVWAQNWQDLHQVFAEHQLKLKFHGNGLVIAQG